MNTTLEYIIVLNFNTLVKMYMLVWDKLTEIVWSSYFFSGKEGHNWDLILVHRGRKIHVRWLLLVFRRTPSIFEKGTFLREREIKLLLSNVECLYFYTIYVIGESYYPVSTIQVHGAASSMLRIKVTVPWQKMIAHKDECLNCTE